jgi:NTE family protein
MNTTISDEKPKQAIVILQGGAALGAYECGAFEVIAPEIDKLQEGLAVVAGTSIGALNAAIIARSYKDQQRTRTGTATAAAKDLKTFWTTVLPNPSPPLFPPCPGLQFPLAEIMQRSLNLWINILQGNRHLFTPDPYALSPFAPAHYSTTALEKTLKDLFGADRGYRGNQPRLIVAAVNVQLGQIETFDSRRGIRSNVPSLPR